jgi:hypothetical protein
MMISSFLNLIGTVFIFCSITLVESNKTHGIVGKDGKILSYAMVKQSWKFLARAGMSLIVMGFAIQLFLYLCGSK